MIQQGVSLDPSMSPHGADGAGMTIGRVMDWIEARLEAIKSREEEEDEEEEREKEKERGVRPGGPTSASARTQPGAKASTAHEPHTSAPPPPKAPVRCLFISLSAVLNTLSLLASLYLCPRRIPHPRKQGPSFPLNQHPLHHLPLPSFGRINVRRKGFGQERNQTSLPHITRRQHQALSLSLMGYHHIHHTLTSPPSPLLWGPSGDMA